MGGVRRQETERDLQKEFRIRRICHGGTEHTESVPGNFNTNFRDLECFCEIESSELGYIGEIGVQIYNQISFLLPCLRVLRASVAKLSEFLTASFRYETKGFNPASISLRFGSRKGGNASRSPS